MVPVLPAALATTEVLTMAEMAAIAVQPQAVAVAEAQAILAAKAAAPILVLATQVEEEAALLDTLPEAIQR
jgi:CO dehydrogenase/acetyl-CoA synthase epsilon subunit